MCLLGNIHAAANGPAFPDPTLDLVDGDDAAVFHTRVAAHLDYADG